MMKVAIYGLSMETEKELPRLKKQYHIIGLLDGFQTDGVLYGQSIISFERAIEEGVEKIIVVARPGSCKAIAKRIGDACKEFGIALFDIRGKDLLAEERVVYDFKDIKGYRYAEFLEQIEKAETVSFDLFDTLVMRRVLLPDDVVELVSARMSERGMALGDFTNQRVAVEKRISQSFAPKLLQIYEEVLRECGRGGDDVSAVSSPLELAALEYETDRELLIPRRDMIMLFDRAKVLGKRVYITTDTYYNQSQIEGILHDNGIAGYDGLFISCEYGKSKQQGLFEELKKTVGVEKLLHIGDDSVSDIRSAEACGIDCAQIYSGAELCDLLGGLGMLAHSRSLSDRIKAGMVVARLFNSPFQFEDEERKLIIRDAVDVGYLFCAPMINDFVHWFGTQTRELNCGNVWFCARDGFLVKKIYQRWFPDSFSEYFLTSRTAAIRSGVETREDVAYIDSMKFSGETADNLRCRFGMDTAEIPDFERDEDEEGLMRYCKAILHTAEKRRENNRKYIDSLHICEGRIAFFDFVAKGTSQFYVGRLVENPIVGLYFLQMDPEYMKDKHLDIKPFYTEEERESSAIFDSYYVLETLLTSPYPSVDEFDNKGEPIYAKELRSDKDIACFMRAQEGILEYVDVYLSICPKSERKVNKKLDEVMLMLIHNVEIVDRDFLELTVEEPFFNRMTAVTDVL